MRIVPLLILLIVLVLQPTVYAQDETQPQCIVTENQSEVFNENQLTMLRATNIITGVVLNETDAITAFETFYPVLQSMRQNHERIAANLPACASAVNTAYTETITAAQDALSLLMAGEATGRDIYVNRVERAREHLAEQWQQLAEATDAADLRTADAPTADL